jgi:hypothetical protein
LNYSSWSKKSPVDGYVFISPKLGYKSGTDRKSNDNDEFAKADLSVFFINIFSFGLLFGNKTAVKLNYPDEIIKNNPLLLKSYTCNMALSLTPKNPARQFKELDKPFCLAVGEKDELFFPDKLIAFGKLPDEKTKDNSVSRIIGNSNHLSILLSAEDLIGDFIKLINK